MKWDGIRPARFRARIVCAALALAVGGAGCTHADRGGGNAHGVPHVLRIGDSADFDSLNPHLDDSATANYIAQLHMAFLFRSDAHNEPVPELATIVPSQSNGGISADGRTITYHLRHGVRWSDGAPFTAQDVIFSAQAVLNPRNNEASRQGWDLITHMDAPDPWTVRFRLRRPFAAFSAVYFGTAGNICILPVHLLGRLADLNHAAYNSKPVGIGPFRVVQWVRGDHVTLEANPLYWRGRPKLDRIIFKVYPDSNTALVQLQTHEIDLWTDVDSSFNDRVSGLPDVTVVRQPLFGFGHLDFNLSHPLFQDVAVRRALRLGLDRATIVHKVIRGTADVQEGIQPPVSPVYSAIPFVGYDPAAANRILDADGWKRGPDGIRVKDGRRLAFTWAASAGNSTIEGMAGIAQSNWRAIGADVSVRYYSTALFFAQPAGILYAGKYDVVFFAWTIDPSGDVQQLYGCSYFPPQGQNTLRWCDPTTDALMQKVGVTYDLPARRALVKGVITRIADQVPTIVIYARKQIHAFHANITGFHPNSVTPFDDMLNVDSN
jgi:peptide/nickel transport system substrate-binding protein